MTAAASTPAPARRPLRLLAVSLRYPPYTAGGYELLTEDAVRGLRERGHEVVVLAGRGERFRGVPDVLGLLEPDLDDARDPFEREREASNAERFRLHFLRLANWRHTARALAGVRPDALLYFNLSLLSTAPILAARCAGVPTLGYAADPWPLNHWVLAWRGNLERGLPEAVGKRGRLAALERAWRVWRELVELGELCVPSEYLRRRFAADGLAPGALPLVPLGMSPAMARRAAGAAPRPRAPGEPLRLVAASMLWEGKGQHVLLEALGRARARGVDAELFLAGGGADAYRQRLERIVARSALAGKVVLGGMLSPEEVSNRLRDAHVFAFPSLWGEPFGLATLEGMAHGLAPLVSDAGASPEIVRDGIDGLVVPAGDVGAHAAAIERLAGDDELRLRLARSARERVETEYAHAGFLDRLEHELRRVVERGPI